MNNTLKIEGHVAVINFDPEIEMFRGEFIGRFFYCLFQKDLFKPQNFFFRRLAEAAGEGQSYQRCQSKLRRC